MHIQRIYVQITMRNDFGLESFLRGQLSEAVYQNFIVSVESRHLRRIEVLYLYSERCTSTLYQSTPVLVQLLQPQYSTSICLTSSVQYVHCYYYKYCFLTC